MKSKSILLVGILALVAITFTQTDKAHADIPPSTVRVSIAYDGSEANGSSSYPSISADGRYVAFMSVATNLVPGDTNVTQDIFVRDTVANTIVRVNVSNTGEEANAGSHDPKISGNGRYVAFSSYASNLVSDDSNGVPDIFVYDLALNNIERVNLNNAGFQAQGPGDSGHPDINYDGRFVTFMAFASNLDPDCTSEGHVYVRDQLLNLTECISVHSDGTPGNAPSDYPAISGNGRYVVFQSGSINLVDTDTNDTADIFLHDTQTGETSLVSVKSDGTQANDYSSSIQIDISGDGAFVFFQTQATNLVDSDTNNATDTFIHEVATGETTRYSLAYDGSQIAGGSWPSISDDGVYLIFAAGNDVLPTWNWYNIYRHDRSLGSTECTYLTWDNWQPNDGYNDPSISGNGRYMVFSSYATNMVPGDYNNETDIFVRDMGVVFDQFVYLPLISR